MDFPGVTEIIDNSLSAVSSTVGYLSMPLLSIGFVGTVVVTGIGAVSYFLIKRLIRGSARSIK